MTPSAWKPVDESAASAWKPVAEGPSAPKETTPVKDFGSALWEGVGGKLVTDILGMASRDPSKAKQGLDSLKSFASGVMNEGPRMMKELDSAGDALAKGDLERVAHHLAGAAPFIGAAVQNAGSEAERGDLAKAAGHTAALFAPFVGGKAAEAAGPASTALKGATSGFADAIANAPESTTGKVVGGAAGGAAGHTVGGWPGAAAGGFIGKEIGSKVTAIPGALKAAVERATVRLQQERNAAGPQRVPVWQQEPPIPNQPVEMVPQVEPATPPGVMPSGRAVPGAAPPVRPMPGQPIPTAISRIQEIAQRPPVEPVAPPIEAPAPAPAEPQPIAPQPNPAQVVEALKQARSPAEQAEIMQLPKGATSQQIAEQLRAMMEESGSLPPQQAPAPGVAPTDTALAPAMQDIPPATRAAMGKSAYRADKQGEVPEGSGVNAIIAGNRANKIQPVVEALRKEGISYKDLATLPADELKQHVDALAKATGQTVFSGTSLEQLMGELKRAEEKPNPSPKPARRSSKKTQ